MSVKSLAQAWAFPDRSSDRAQITLRLSYNDYARLHALKEVFPGRSVNDMLNDLIRSALDELVDSLELNVQTHESYQMDLMDGLPVDVILPIGGKYGKRFDFDCAYRRLLDEKLDDRPDLKIVQTQEQKSNDEPKEAA